MCCILYIQSPSMKMLKNIFLTYTHTHVRAHAHSLQGSGSGYTLITQVHASLQICLPAGAMVPLMSWSQRKPILRGLILDLQHCCWYHFQGSRIPWRSKLRRGKESCIYLIHMTLKHIDSPCCLWLELQNLLGPWQSFSSLPTMGKESSSSFLGKLEIEKGVYENTQGMKHILEAPWQNWGLVLW